MSLLFFLISLLITGLFVGALGRLLLPGRDPMSIPQTVLVGVASTLIAGLLGSALLGRNAGSLVLSVLVAVGVVYLIRRSRRGRAPIGHGHAAHRRSPVFGGRSARNL